LFGYDLIIKLLISLFGIGITGNTVYLIASVGWVLTPTHFKLLINLSLQQKFYKIYHNLKLRSTTLRLILIL